MPNFNLLNKLVPSCSKTPPKLDIASGNSSKSQLWIKAITSK